MTKSQLDCYLEQTQKDRETTITSGKTKNGTLCLRLAFLIFIDIPSEVLKYALSSLILVFVLFISNALQVCKSLSSGSLIRLSEVLPLQHMTLLSFRLNNRSIATYYYIFYFQAMLSPIIMYYQISSSLKIFGFIWFSCLFTFCVLSYILGYTLNYIVQDILLKLKTTHIQSSALLSILKSVQLSALSIHLSHPLPPISKLEEFLLTTSSSQQQKRHDMNSTNIKVHYENSNSDSDGSNNNDAYEVIACQAVRKSFLYSLDTLKNRLDEIHQQYKERYIVFNQSSLKIQNELDDLFQSAINTNMATSKGSSLSSSSSSSSSSSYAKSSINAAHVATTNNNIIPSYASLSQLSNQLLLQQSFHFIYELMRKMWQSDIYTLLIDMLMEVKNSCWNKLVSNIYTSLKSLFQVSSNWTGIAVSANINTNNHCHNNNQNHHQRHSTSTSTTTSSSFEDILFLHDNAFFRSLNIRPLDYYTLLDRHFSPPFVTLMKCAFCVVFLGWNIIVTFLALIALRSAVIEFNQHLYETCSLFRNETSYISFTTSSSDGSTGRSKSSNNNDGINSSSDESIALVSKQAIQLYFDTRVGLIKLRRRYENILNKIWLCEQSLSSPAVLKAVGQLSIHSATDGELYINRRNDNNDDDSNTSQDSNQQAVKSNTTTDTSDVYKKATVKLSKMSFLDSEYSNTDSSAFRSIPTSTTTLTSPLVTPITDESESKLQQHAIVGATEQLLLHHPTHTEITAVLTHLMKFQQVIHHLSHGDTNSASSHINGNIDSSDNKSITSNGSNINVSSNQSMTTETDERMQSSITSVSHYTEKHVHEYDNINNNQIITNDAMNTYRDSMEIIDADGRRMVDVYIGCIPTEKDDNDSSRRNSDDDDDDDSTRRQRRSVGSFGYLKHLTAGNGCSRVYKSTATATTDGSDRNNHALFQAAAVKSIEKIMMSELNMRVETRSRLLVECVRNEVVLASTINNNNRTIATASLPPSFSNSISLSSSPSSSFLLLSSSPSCDSTENNRSSTSVIVPEKQESKVDDCNGCAAVEVTNEDVAALKNREVIKNAEEIASFVSSSCPSPQQQYTQPQQSATLLSQDFKSALSQYHRMNNNHQKEISFGDSDSDAE